MKENTNWGIIGVGDVCEVKSAPAMNLIEGSRLVAVMRRNGDKAKDYAARHHVPRWYNDAEALINDPEVNAVYIATPPGFHCEYTLKAAQAGKPVYVEKPMARTYDECMTMIEACKNAAVPLFVAYYRRTLPHFLKVKEIIDNGIIGEVRMINIDLVKPVEPDIVAFQADNWRVDPDIAGGGYFYDLASHQLDFLDYVLGPVQNVKGYASNQAGMYKAEDIVTAIFSFENGVLGTGSWCFTTSEASDRDVTTIVGSKGQLSYASFGAPEVTLEVAGKSKEVFSFELPPHVQQPLIQTVVDELHGKGRCPSTGASAARTNFVMESIVKNNL